MSFFVPLIHSYITKSHNQYIWLWDTFKVTWFCLFVFNYERQYLKETQNFQKLALILSVRSNELSQFQLFGSSLAVMFKSLT